jgi:hypothetical protein
MFLYRASNLACGRTSDTEVPSWEYHLATLAGRSLHAVLAEKIKGLGDNIEQEQIVFCAEKDRVGEPIRGVLSGRADRW